MLKRLRDYIANDMWSEASLVVPTWIRIFIVFAAIPLLLLVHFIYRLISSRGTVILLPELELAGLLPVVMLLAALLSMWLRDWADPFPDPVEPPIETDHRRSYPRIGRLMWIGGSVVIFVCALLWPGYPADLAPILCIPPTAFIIMGIYLEMRRR